MEGTTLLLVRQEYAMNMGIRTHARVCVYTRGNDPYLTCSLVRVYARICAHEMLRIWVYARMRVYAHIREGTILTLLVH